MKFCFSLVKAILVLIVLTTLSCDKEEEILPSILILSPTDNSVLSESFDVEVSVSSSTIIKVELYINNVLTGFAEDTPYRFTVNISSYSSGDYTLKAVAFTASGKIVSDESQIKIAKPSLGKPMGLAVSKGNFGSKILIQWNPVPLATNYEIYRLDNVSNKYLKIGLSNGVVFEDITIASPLTQYFYKIRVFNSEIVFSDFTEADYGYTSGKAYDLINSFGQEGTAENEFGFVPLISIDDKDVLYLSDVAQTNIKKYSIDGVFQGLLKSNVDSQAPVFIGNKTISTQNESLVIDEDDHLKISINTGLNIVGQMTSDSDGNIYFAVNYNSAEGYNHHRIYKYDVNGNLITSWGSKGNEEGQLNEPWGVSFYKENIVVTCQVNKRAQFFTKSGQFIRSIDLSKISSTTYGNYLKNDALYVAAGSFVLKTDLDGKIVEKIGEGILNDATSVVVDSKGNIIVAEPYSRKIRVFKKS